MSMTAAADFRAIEIARIDDDDRLRPVDEAYVAMIAASMAATGLSEPIIVRPHPTAEGRFKLVAGAHRLAGGRLNEWTEIPAIVRELEDAEAQLVEIDENLMRRELGPLDRAIFLAKRKVVWEALYPATKNGGDPKTKKTLRDSQMANLAIRFSKDASEKTGLSERSIRRATSLVASLTPDALRLARQTYLARHGGDLAALAAMDPAEQVAAASKIASGEIKTLSSYRPAPKRPADEVHFEKMVDLWSRTGTKVRRRFLAHIGVETPKKPALSVANDAADLDEVG